MDKKEHFGRIQSAVWGVKLALRMNPFVFLCWTTLSVGLSILPAVALGYQKAILEGLSSMLAAGAGEYSAILSDILILGILLTVSGLSSRINADFLFMMMYDSYYLGMEEIIMDSAQKIDLTEFARKEARDEYHACAMRGGSLTDFLTGLCLLLGKIALVVSLLQYAFRNSVAVFFASALYIAAILFLNVRYSGKVRLDWAKEQKDIRYAESLEKLPQETDTAKEIRIFENGETVYRQWTRAYHPVERSAVKRVLGISLQAFAGSICFLLFMAAALTFLLFRVADGTATPALYITIYTLCLNISSAAANITAGYQKMDYGLFPLDRQRRFFQNTPKESPDPEKAETFLDDTTLFSAKNLSFSYDGEKPVLKNLTFSLKKGETVALVGSNGCGKTTLVKLLLGLYRPTSGELLFGGRPYDAYRPGFISRKIGTFFQDFYLYKLTLRENVGAGNVSKMQDTDLILRAIERGGASGVLKKLSKGLEHVLGRNLEKEGAQLSGGEGQRVAVSRAHMSDKEILIFDEPASMLDPIAEMEQFFQIKGKIGGKTAVLVSHRIGFARLADRILVLSGGEITEDGTHEELLAKKGVYAEFFRKQAEWYDTSPAKESEVSKA